MEMKIEMEVEIDRGRRRDEDRTADRHGAREKESVEAAGWRTGRGREG